MLGEGCIAHILHIGSAMKMGSSRCSEKGREFDGFVLCTPIVRRGATFKVAQPGTKITHTELVQKESKRSHNLDVILAPYFCPQL